MLKLDRNTVRVFNSKKNKINAIVEVLSVKDTISNMKQGCHGQGK